MNKKIFMIGLITAMVIITATVVIQFGKKTTPIDSRKIKIVTTLFPLYDIAQNITGDKAEVSLLLTPGIEAHSFEPKPSDFIKINEADIFIYTGKFMEPWVEDLLKGISNDKIIIVDASKNTKKITAIFHDEDEPAGSFDPHIWLDFDNTKIITENIKQAVINKDVSNSNSYEQNANSYTERLNEIDTKYLKTLSSCKNKEIIHGGHYALGYMTNRYDLKYSAAQGFSPDSEPTVKDMINLVNQIKKNNIKYIFYEELSSPKIADTIAKETNVKMLLLNAGHNLTKDQFRSKLSFFDIMENNLQNLKIGLDCQ